jgi:hypothetical protein
MELILDWINIRRWWKRITTDLAKIYNIIFYEEYPLSQEEKAPWTQHKTSFFAV